MRKALAILALICAVAGTSGGVVCLHYRHAVESARVAGFNDGFTDGACHDGQDGFGHVCKEG